MRGKDGDDEDASEPVHGFGGADADAAHFAQGAHERAPLAAGFTAELQRDSAALAVIRFGKVDELEVEGEGAREQNGPFDGKRVDQFECFFAVQGRFIVFATRFGIATADGALAQCFDVFEEGVAGLLAQNFAQQRTQGAHVAAQWSFFQLTGTRFEFGQPLRPAFGIPQEGHRLFDYA